MLGAGEGFATVTAESGGIQASSEVTVEADPGDLGGGGDGEGGPGLETLSKDGGDGQSGVVGTQLPLPLRVSVLDAGGSPLPAAIDLLWSAY